MKIKELLSEDTGSLAPAVARTMPATFELPGLKNQDPYMQYRMGLALASARSDAIEHENFDTNSAFGENMSIVGYTNSDIETIQLALKLIGKEYSAGARMISTKESQEASDVYTQSPIQPRGPITRK